MKITLETVLAAARLARLDLASGLSAAEAPRALERLAGEFGGIVAYMDILAEVDTTSVEPLYSPSLDPPPPREDQPRDSGLSQDILAEAPETKGGFFAVPAII